MYPGNYSFVIIFEMFLCQIIKSTFNVNMIKSVNHYQNIEVIFLIYSLQNGMNVAEIIFFIENE